MVFGDNVFVNFEMCSSINFSIVRWACSSGNSQITVLMCGVCGFRHAVNRTPGAFPIKSGHLVCNIDSKSSHSSVEGNVLMKIFVYMIARLTKEWYTMQLTRVLEFWLSSQILSGSVKTALEVGTIPAFINQYDLIFSWSFTPQCWMKMGLTCMVLCSVASGTATKTKLEVPSLSWSLIMALN